MKLLLRCGGVLFAITLIMGALLGYVNYVTAPRIAQLAEETRLASIARVLDGDILGDEAVLEASGESTVKEIVLLPTTKGTAYAVTAAPKGYGGEIKLMIGIDADLAVTGVSVMEMSETPGLGQRANDESFLGQFIGKDPEIKAITGATITSNAIKTGIADAIAEVEQIIKEGKSVE